MSDESHEQYKAMLVANQVAQRFNEEATALAGSLSIIGLTHADVARAVREYFGRDPHTDALDVRPSRTWLNWLETVEAGRRIEYHLSRLRCGFVCKYIEAGGELRKPAPADGIRQFVESIEDR